MSQQNIWLLTAFLGYSLYSALMGKVITFASSGVILSVYMTTTAIFSWVFVIKNGQVDEIHQLSWFQIVMIAGIGLIVFVSDFAYTKLFVLKVPNPVIYGFIAWVAVGTMLFLSLFEWRWPTWQQMAGVTICCYGAYVINTGKFGPP